MTTPIERSGATAPDWVLAAATLVLVFAVQIPFIHYHAILFDEGLIVQQAVDINRGKVPYRDGLHYAFPGVFYLTAALFEVFGTSIDAVRLLAAGMFAAAVTFLVLMCRWWCTRGETLVLLLIFLSYRVWSFPHWHMINYSPMAVTAALGATWAAGEHIARRGYGWALAAGLFCGVAILSKQDSGGAATVAIGLAMLLLGVDTVWRRRLRNAVVFSSTVFLVVGACLLAVWWAGYLGDLWREAVYAPLYGVTNYEYLRRPPLLPLFAQDENLRQNHFSYFPQIFMEAYGSRLFDSEIYRNTGRVDAAIKLVYHSPWMVALIAAAVLALRALRGDRSVEQQRRVLALLLAGAYLLAFNPPHDWVHLLVLYPATLLLLGCAVPLLRGHRIARAALVALAAALFLSSAHLVVELCRRHSEPVATARGTFYTRPIVAAGFREVLAAIEQTPADQPLLAYPYHIFLNFLGDRPILSRYMSLWPVEWNENRDAEVIAALEAKPATTVLYGVTQFTHLGSPRDFAHEFYRYLTDNYVVDQVHGRSTPGMLVLQLRREAVPSSGSLHDAVVHQSRLTRTLESGESVRLEGEPADLMRIIDWPFHRTIVLTTYPAAEMAVHIPIEPRTGDRLITAFATNPDHWELGFYPSAEFRLAIDDGEGPAETLLRRKLRPGPVPEDRDWFDVDIDLTPWAGRSADLVLGVSTEAGTFPRNDLAGWRMPYIIAQEPAEPAPP